MASITKQPILFLAMALLASSAGFSQSVSDIRDELLHMRNLDQQGRQEIRLIEEEYGYDSPEWRAAWDDQNAVDMANMARLEEIIGQIGWPGESAVGDAAAMGAFLILQHADLDAQKKYLPVLRDAVDAGEADARSYALLYDRVLLREDRKQLYGTQLMRNEQTGGYYLWPVEDADQVDARRAELGMPPLEEELSRYPVEIGPVPQEIEEGF